MSLADQSQQWFPTSVQVTVHQARNLRAKGKNGTNDSYAIIQVAKDKFSTSVSEKSVDPVWKEEASFDLPLFHPSNSDRCTLFVIVMHRAQVGLDKFLGQAVVKLLDLHDNKTSKKTDWFKLVDKSGKEDKARGEVLLDIQFMRNNMSASMIDLSMQDKPRSRMSKFKDKVRGKKKDNFSDSSSAVVSSVGTVLTDSEGDADAQSLSQSDGLKKKSKLKTLFAPKSNLQRNVSQSMSTLGTLPARNSSISSSRSSGLNVDSTEVKKKFKFTRGHKRTESSDSKVSLGVLSLLGRSKQSSSDLNNMCVNGSHVYAEETDPTSGSTLSLNSSGQGSVEDVHKFREVCVDSFVSIPVSSLKLDSADGAILEQQRHQEEEERRRQTEEKHLAEAKRLEEEEKHRLEARRLQEEEEQRRQEEQERKRCFLEEEARREEERKKQEEAAESQRLEEQRQQEEASMSDRLTSLFGILRKKEEKKEELHSAEEPVQATSPSSPSPFEDIPLSSDPPAGSNESPADHQTSISNPQTPTSMVFLNRNAKVSAVKPRFTQSLESEPADCQTPSHSESTLSSVPSESPDTFSRLHSLLDPRQSPPGSPSGSTEDLTSPGSSPTMADKRRRAPMPPSYTEPGGNTARESRNHAETDGTQPGRKISLPLPDYDTLYPQRRHGVQGETRWDHIIAEVNQKHRDYAEMSVDGPEEHTPSLRSSLPEESPAAKYYNTQPQESKPISSKKVAAPAPPKSAPTHHRSESGQSAAHHHEDTTRGSLSVTSREALSPSPEGSHAPRPVSQVDQVGTVETDIKNKYAPTAKPRLRTSGTEPFEQEDAAVTSETYMTSHIQTYRPHMISTNTNSQQAKENFDFDPFPSNDLLSKDPWEAGDFITSSVQKEQKVEDRGMTPDDLDQIFGQEKQTDPFADFNGRDSSDSSPVSQRRNSQRRKQIPASTAHSDTTTSRPRQEYDEEMSSTSADQVLYARSVRNESTTPKLPANSKTQIQSYGGEDQFAAQPFISTLNLSERLEVVLEEVEPTSQPGGLSGGKAPLRAWVSPSDVQRVSAQSSNGDGLAFTPRRPHPVKPMNSDNQYPISSPAVKDTKVRDSSAGKLQAADPVGSGPFTQLTQEELITLVVRQQADLSKKDTKITELEEYIDNLLVRVIDEQPSILQAINFTKPV